jgi:very-short-patch-repair endonuclease
VKSAPDLTQAEFDSLYDELCRLVSQHERIGTFSPASPFWGFFPTSLPPGAEVEIECALDLALPKLDLLNDKYEQLEKLINATDIALTKENTKMLVASLMRVSEFSKSGMAEELLPKIFESPKNKGDLSEKILLRLLHQQKQAIEARREFEGKINNDIQVEDSILTECARINSVLKNLGLSTTPLEGLESIGESIRQMLSESHFAIEEFRVLSTISNIAFIGTDLCISRTTLPIEFSATCPKEHLHLRSTGLGLPGSSKIILEAKLKFSLLDKHWQELCTWLYPDVHLSEQEVANAVQTLREGDEWWRIFQSRHRAATAFHKRLSKKRKLQKYERLNELENLHEYLRNFRLAKEDTQCRKVMGVNWNAESTEFDALASLASWIESVKRQLIESSIEDDIFDALNIPAQKIAALSKSIKRLSGAKASLERCFKYVTEGPFSNTSSVTLGFRQAKNWDDRIKLLETLRNRITEYKNALSQWAPRHECVDSIFPALRAFSEFQKIKSDIDNDDECKQLLSSRHLGLDTDVTPALDALEYGRAVLGLDLAENINRYLLSNGGDRLRDRLITMLSDIECAWLPIDSFCDFMSGHGHFDMESWAGNSLSSPEFIGGFKTRAIAAKLSISNLLEWVKYNQASSFAKERGLLDYVKLLEADDIPRSHVPELYGYRFYGSIAEDLFNKHRVLGKFSALSHEAIRDEFRKLDKEIINLRGRDVAASASSIAKPAWGSTGPRVGDKTERVLLNYLFPQARPRMPIRKMMLQAGRSIQEFKPCFMMGPQAVAQYLAPDAVKFDIVVMDEASQLKPEEAIGAIARGTQLVVVGDPKQLPPTTFFDKLGETQDEDDTKQQSAVMQPSILEVCIGHFRPVRTLRWHYRSQHHSLIAFSNARFYRNNLIVFPSPYERSRNLGCKLQYIPGAIYDSQMNVKEAQAVVEAVLSHMRNRPDDNLGVVTLNLKQRELIDELLQKRMREMEYVDQFVNRHEKEGYGFFVKNLENVQGDERDVIFISTTFGPAPGSNAVFQRFGPISQRDGWRRLNVLFTRARKSLTVFTSMRPEDIVDGENVPRGRRELRAYLEYLRTGQVPKNGDSYGPPESDFEVSVLEALERHNYSCTPQLGVAGYRIDLAVKHPLFPGTHLAAIECDGASYHSGRSARDRDRIRQEILESLGWKGRIYRIWSTDWYRAPANELGRLIAWLDKLKSEPMDQAYLVSDSTAPSTPLAAAEHDIDQLGVEIESEDSLEVQVGDKVTYRNVANDQDITITISTRTDDLRGMVDYRAPLADALLGLQEGEIGVISIPGRQSIRVRVVKIIRGTG